MKLKIMRNILAVFLFSNAFAASATLIGDTVGTRYTGSGGGDTGINWDVVGAGEEGNFAFNQFYDYDALSFDIRSTSDFCGLWTCNAIDTVTLSLSSLDFTSGALTNVLLDTNLTGVSFVFGADFVDFTWNEQAITTGTYLSAIFETSSVPEPSIAFLLATGLIGIVGMARRRRLS